MKAICLLALTSSVFGARTLHVPGEYPTIQAAIDAADPQDTVLVAPGLYLERIVLDEEITVRSSGGPAVTTIDAGRTGSVVRITAPGRPVIEGFTITGGLGPLSGSNGAGGGIWCQGSPAIRGNVIAGNWTSTLPQPGSRGLGGGIYALGGSPEIVGNEIRDNRATVGWGGGICCVSAAGALIRGNLVTRNDAAFGGGIRASGTAVIEANVVALNTLSGDRYTTGTHGGGIDCLGAVTVRGNLVHGNRVADTTTAEGGGIAADELAGVIERNVVQGNQAFRGGGIHSTGAGRIDGNLVLANTAAQEGGGIFSMAAAVTGNVIAGNQASLGGGVGGGVGGAFLNNTVIGNVATSSGGGYFSSYLFPGPVANCIFQWNAAPSGPQIAGGVQPPVTNTDIAGGWPGVGNIDADPLFADLGALDFHLTARSPCRGTGDPLFPGLPATDFEGDPRVTGGLVDMGADAFHPHLYLVGSVQKLLQVKTVAEPGSEVLWVFSTTPTLREPPLSVPGCEGFVWLLPPLQAVSLGRAPESGIVVLELPLLGQQVPPGTYPTQSLVLGAGGCWITNVAVVEVP
jgi:hypothetical protein